jgi:hypothetical protein
LASRIAAAKGVFHLIQGQGVTEDPTWGSYARTFDGRDWSNVPGAGGAPYSAGAQALAPTRIVVNRLYEGHGSVNLVLHEHGHSLDSVYSYRGISGSGAWLRHLNESPALRGFLTEICGTYCTDYPQEGFAEAFAYYHSCAAAREELTRKTPAVAKFLEELPTKVLRKLD